MRAAQEKGRSQAAPFHRRFASTTLVAPENRIRKEGRSMANCWERRGCDDEMMARCPHNIGRDLCPTECWNAACYRSNHVIATDFELLLNSDRDYSAAIKEICHFCEFSH